MLFYYLIFLVMLQFIKDSMRELQHVVWPSRKETQKYFGLVLAMLVFFGLYLFLFSNIFSELVFSFKTIFSNSNSTIDASINEDTLLQGEDLLISDEVNVNVDNAGQEAVETLSGAVQ